MLAEVHGRMSESRAYGRRLADGLHSESFRVLALRRLRKGAVGFREICSGHPNGTTNAGNAPHVGDHRYEPGSGVDDPIVRALTSVLYPALDRPDQANTLFVDCIMVALG